MKKLIAGNWKMNTNKDEAKALALSIVNFFSDNSEINDLCDILICPPFIYISEVQTLCREHNIAVGAQDCSTFNSGAYTGDISPQMLKDTGCEYVIVGHSERREYHEETDDIVSKKAKTVHENGMVAIICIGESGDERNAGVHEKVVQSQLLHSLPEGATAQNTVIAYEPVWAIGTGKTASPEDVADMHKFIRSKLQECLTDGEKIRILYGGSMKAGNAEELLSTPNVDGGLIGGASLNVDQFIAIAQKA